MTNEEIRAWLKASGKDRHWLADQVGCTYGTLTQWFSKGFPEWAVKSIALLASPPKDKGAGLELTFTDAEFDDILQAMKLTGYSLRREFYHDAITEKARQVIETETADPSKITAHPSLSEMGGEDRHRRDQSA